MQNFESKIITVERTLKTLGGIFERNEVEIKLKEIEVILQKKIFGKIRI